MTESLPFIEVQEKIKNFNVFVDLDNTTKEHTYLSWTDGKKRKLRPETVAGFATLHKEGFRIGIATEQAVTEAEPFLQDVAQLALQTSDYHTLFNGISIAEGGAVVKKIKNGFSEWKVIAPEGAMQERLQVIEWFKSSIVEINEDTGYGTLIGTNPQESTWVQLAPSEKQGLATISLWEDGPPIYADVSYAQKYAKIQQFVNEVMRQTGIRYLSTYEAGNGTLRIVPRMINKAKTLGLLNAIGVLDLMQCMYFCDGPNDVAAAHKIVGLNKDKGIVIAVKNAVQELHDLSFFSATQPEGLGFAEFIQHTFPKQFSEEITRLRDLGLWLADDELN